MERAEYAEGLITTVNASDVTITAPAVCLHVRSVDGTSTAFDPGVSPRGAATADRFQRLLDRAEKNIGAFAEPVLLTILRSANEQSIADRLLVLLKTNLAELAERGYFQFAGL